MCCCADTVGEHSVVVSLVSSLFQLLKFSYFSSSIVGGIVDSICSLAFLFCVTERVTL